MTFAQHCDYILNVIKLYTSKAKIRGWRDGAGVKSTYNSCREPGFESHLPTEVTPVPGKLISFAVESRYIGIHVGRTLPHAPPPRVCV